MHVLNNRTLVPVRFISENFGADVSWNADEKKVTVKGEKTIELTIDDPKIVIDGSEQALDAAAVVVDNRTMLPLRALCEALGKNTNTYFVSRIFRCNGRCRRSLQPAVPYGTFVPDRLARFIPVFSTSFSDDSL